MPPHQASGERDAPLASGGGPSLPAEGAPSAPSLDHCPGDTPQHLLMTPPLGDMTPNPHPDTALGEGGVAGLLVLVFVLLLVLVVVVVVVVALVYVSLERVMVQRSAINHCITAVNMHRSWRLLHGNLGKVNKVSKSPREM